MNAKHIIRGRFSNRLFLTLKHFTVWKLYSYSFCASCFQVATASAACTVVAFAVSHALLASLEAAQASVLVAYVVNPHGLYDSCPDAYAQLHDAWRAARKPTPRAPASSLPRSQAPDAVEFRGGAVRPAEAATADLEQGALGSRSRNRSAAGDEDDDRTVTLGGGLEGSADRPSSSSADASGAAAPTAASPARPAEQAAAALTPSRLAERSESQSRGQSQGRSQSLTRGGALSPEQPYNVRPAAAPPPRAGSGFARTHVGGGGRFSDSAPRPEDVAAAAAQARALAEALHTARAEGESVPRGNDI